MTNETSVKTACPSCGKPLAGGEMGGLCPACLLAHGMDTREAGERGRFEPPEVEEVARLFPQWEIDRRIGVGGMGAVYRVRQPALDRWVALKVLPAGGMNSIGFAERFQREARALARLNHPNIVAVYEFGEVQGYRYFLMELVEGANLRELLRTGRISPREALQIVPQICDALQYAHDEGVVHRDIKPENVLVDRRGRVKIADFGLARILGVGGGRERLTADGQVMGTPHYMAPEQVDRPMAVDHRADIYSLGVVFYELLTGDLPLGKFPPPSRKGVEVDVRLDEIVLRALENDPERRYQRAGEVKTRVETLLEGAGTAQGVVAESVAGEEARVPEVGRPNWREWIPFQSRQAKEIYRHYTPEEDRQDLLLGLRLVVPFLAISVLVVLAFAGLLNLRRPGSAILLGMAYVAATSVLVDRSGARVRRFLASTAWARRRGWTADTLPLYSVHPWEPVGGGGPGASLGGVKGWVLLTAVLLAGALIGGPVLWDFFRAWGKSAPSPAQAVMESVRATGAEVVARAAAQTAGEGAMGEAGGIPGDGEVLRRDLSLVEVIEPAVVGELLQAPGFRYLAWQREERGVQPEDLFDARGVRVNDAEGQRLLTTLRQPGRTDVSATEAGKREPRFLHLWIEHPFFDRWSRVSVTLRTSEGALIPLGADGTVSTGFGEAEWSGKKSRWCLVTLSPGEGDRVPESLDVQCEYAVGPAERMQGVPADFQGSMGLGFGGNVSGVGQGSDGRAFLAFAYDTRLAEDRWPIVHAVLKDGREVKSDGTTTSGPAAGGVRVEQHAFGVPLSGVKEFRVGSRPVRKVLWKGVQLPPRFW